MINLLIGAVLLFMSCSANNAEPARDDFGDDYEWDLLVYTQQWPETACKEWVHHDPRHTCNLPKKADSWSVHGIWPDKLHTRGPNFCNRTWHFDPEQIRPIETQLTESWTNIEAGTETYSFWAHEWTKHGTCAAAIEPLNSEFKYFSMGLKLFEKFEMGPILAKKGIVPDDNNPYSLLDIYNTVKGELGINPSIQCRIEERKSYLVEIRICLNKKLELIDCDGITKMPKERLEGVSIITNCDASRGIYYPHNKWPVAKHLVELYKLISWLQWFTF